MNLCTLRVIIGYNLFRDSKVKEDEFKTHANKIIQFELILTTRQSVKN